MKVQGRVYKDDWVSCTCDLDTSAENPRYICAECGGSGQVPRDVLTVSERAYREMRRTNNWNKRCNHCNGVGWHP